MIGFLKGTMQARIGEAVVIATPSGVGYRVVGSFSAAVGVPIECFVSHIMRENQQTLYGFKTLEELQTFETLLGVSGVGPKSAFVIVSALRPKEIHDAVTRSDAALFATIPGIGKRVASKIVIELKDKLEEPVHFSGEDDALVDALKRLGYSRSEIRGALTQLESGDLTLEQKLSQALKWMGKRKGQ